MVPNTGVTMGQQKILLGIDIDQDLPSAALLPSEVSSRVILSDRSEISLLLIDA